MCAIVAPLVEHDFPESRPDHHAKRDEDEEHVHVDNVDPVGHQRAHGDEVGAEQPAHEEQRVPREFTLTDDEHHGIGSPMNAVHGGVTLARAVDRAALLEARWRRLPSAARIHWSTPGASRIENRRWHGADDAMPMRRDPTRANRALSRRVIELPLNIPRAIDATDGCNEGRGR